MQEWSGGLNEDEDGVMEASMKPLEYSGADMQSSRGVPGRVIQTLVCALSTMILSVSYLTEINCGAMPSGI
jgi:hypothetical protein